MVVDDILVAGFGDTFGFSWTKPVDISSGQMIRLCWPWHRRTIHEINTSLLRKACGRLAVNVTINNTIYVSREHFSGGVVLPRTKGFLAQIEGRGHVRWHLMLGTK